MSKIRTMLKYPTVIDAGIMGTIAFIVVVSLVFLIGSSLDSSFVPLNAAIENIVN